MNSRPKSKNPFSHYIGLYAFWYKVYMRLSSWVLPPQKCQTIFGSYLTCKARDFVQRRIKYFGVYEHNLTYYVMRKLTPGSIFLDIGANIGYFTLLASKLVGPEGKVIAIEAVPSTYKLLQDNIKYNECANVHAINIAVTKERCKVDVCLGEHGNIGSNTVVQSQAGEIEGYPLKDIIRDIAGRIEFIKIDIDNSEAPILEALLEMADQLSPNLTIAAEVGPSSAKFVRKFNEAGFSCHGISNDYSISYYLVRNFLALHNESDHSNLMPVENFTKDYRDYIFSRGRISGTLT